MTTFRCLSDILITSWLFTAWWSTWPGNHLVPCVAELVGSCIPIHAHLCLPDPKCLFYPSGLSLCLSVDHFSLAPVDDMVLFHGMVCDGWLLSYTALPCPGGSGLCTSCERVHFFLVFLDPQTELPACLSNIWANATELCGSSKRQGQGWREDRIDRSCPLQELLQLICWRDRQEVRSEDQETV